MSGFRLRLFLTIVFMGALLGASMADFIPHCGGQVKVASHCDGCPDQTAPCKDMALLCAAGAGCIAVLQTASTAAIFSVVTMPEYPLAQRLLTGRIIKPGLEPPIAAA